MIAQTKPKKYHFQGYAISLLFKTNYSLQITVVDQFSLQTFQNKNVEFTKMQKDAVIASIQKKSEKHLQCKIIRLKQDRNCLQVQFTAQFDFIPPFQEKTILYKVQKIQKDIKLTALDRQTYFKFKSQILQIQNMIPIQKVPIKTLDVASIQLKTDTKQKQKFYFVIIGSNIALFIVFLFFISFSNYFVLVLLLNAGFYFYEANYPYKIISFILKKGIYNIQISAVYTSLNYKSTSCNLTLDLKGQDQSYGRSIKTHNMYSYGYPINTSIIIQAKKDSQWILSAKKDTVFSEGQLTNALIVIQPTTYLRNGK